MTSPTPNDDLATIIHRYGEVANAVNRREMQRFIDVVKSKWHPEPEDPETKPHLDGYTDAGRFNLEISPLAFDDPDPPRWTDAPLCEAEQYNQVLLLPEPALETFVVWMPRPLADPAPSERIKERMRLLRAFLREQVEEVSKDPHLAQVVDVPEDFHHLMSLTDGLQGAGVPAEIDQLELIHPFERQRPESGVRERISYWVRSRFQGTALAAWRIGGSFQHRSVYYVFCRKNGEEMEWKIFDLDHVWLEIYGGFGGVYIA